MRYAIRDIRHTASAHRAPHIANRKSQIPNHKSQIANQNAKWQNCEPKPKTEGAETECDRSCVGWRVHGFIGWRGRLEGRVGGSIGGLEGRAVWNRTFGGERRRYRMAEDQYRIEDQYRTAARHQGVPVLQLTIDNRARAAVTERGSLSEDHAGTLVPISDLPRKKHGGGRVGFAKTRSIQIQHVDPRPHQVDLFSNQHLVPCNPRLPRLLFITSAPSSTRRIAVEQVRSWLGFEIRYRAAGSCIMDRRV